MTQQLPNYNALLLDIRGHGNSTSEPSYFKQPHNFTSCVNDIFSTLSPLGLVGEKSPSAICGHSLGGRIALQYSHILCTNKDTNNNTQQQQQDSSSMIRPPKQTWVLDSVPGKADPSVHNVLRAISSLPTPIPSKPWLVDTLVTDYKMNKEIAMWIATNLRSDNGNKSFDWIFDLEIANELVMNFTDQNFVDMIQDVTHLSPEDEMDYENERKSTTVHLVMAGKNKLWSEEIVNELESIPTFQRQQSSSSSASSFRMHTLEKAGHWVHVDDVDGLLKLMVDGLQQK